MLLWFETDFSNPCSSRGAGCGWGKFSLPWGNWTKDIFKVHLLDYYSDKNWSACWPSHRWSSPRCDTSFFPVLTILYWFDRHAVQLLSPASIVAKMNGRDNICKVIIWFFVDRFLNQFLFYYQTLNMYVLNCVIYRPILRKFAHCIWMPNHQQSSFKNSRKNTSHDSTQTSWTLSNIGAFH